MKIGIFAYTGDEPILDTGVTTFNRELVRSLCERYPQHAFSIYLAERNARKFADIAPANLRKIVVPTSSSNRVRAGARLLSRVGYFAGELLRRLGVRRPMRHELLDSIEGLADCDLMIYTVFGFLPEAPLYVTRNFGIKCISAIHDIRVLYSDLEDTAKGALRRRVHLAISRYQLSRIVRESALSLVPSNYIRERLAEKYRSDAPRIRVSYVVPDLDEVADASAPISTPVQDFLNSGRKYIFYPSTIVETKNHINLVRAMVLLRESVPDATLILAGSNQKSELAAQIFAIVAEHGLRENVLHFGFVSESEKIGLYRGAVALVVPSFGESFSLPIWEAFATGCPVIASTDRDIPEQVGDAAVPCDPTSPKDIANRIREVWTDEGLRRRLSEAGLARYEIVRRNSLFSGWESILDQERDPVRATYSLAGDSVR